MAALRRFASSSARSLSSSGFAPPPLRRTPSASAEAAPSFRHSSSVEAPPSCRHSLRRLLSNPPCGPPLSQGSSAGPEEGEWSKKIFQAMRKNAVVKAVVALVSGFGALSLSSEVYSVYCACRGDVPIRKQKEFWVPSSMFDGQALMNTAPNGSFYFVFGLPGIGKTTQICRAARERGGAVIYVDGAAKGSFSSIREDVNERYPRLHLTIIAWLLRRHQSGLQVLDDLSLWVKRLRGMHLIFIVDHVDKLKPSDAVELASWAKTAADERKFKVILVGSELSSNILAANDARTRCALVECFPPSAHQIRQALTEYISTHPKKSMVDVERMLYLLGPVPSLYGRGIEQTEQDMVNSFSIFHKRVQMQGRALEDDEFWYSLLIAGSNGIEELDDTNKVLSDPCILDYGGRIYFVSGCSRDLHAKDLLYKYRNEVKKAAARIQEAENNIANAIQEEKKIAMKSSNEMQELQSADKVLALKIAQQKLIKLNERIAKIEEVMCNQTYEAYGPSIGHNA